MIGRVRDFVRDRTGLGDGPRAMISGGPSFAHVLGWALVLVLAIEAVTGAALAAFYSPSATDAWASVAYVQDRVPLGWFVRGVHHHGASALVIVAGIHLVQTAVWGAYKKPRELTWWLGLLSLVLVLALAITGYVLRWDQDGYWANRVEVGIAASTPVVGDQIRALAIGGNDYGNLTLTRFYALHVIVLPALIVLVVAVHIWLARRHGVTPRWDRHAAPQPRWPAQTVRNAMAMALVMAALFAFVVHRHGADLAAPADASMAHDARPLWFFRWLFELRHLAGSFEQLAALAAPAIVGGFLVALPLLDRGAENSPRRRLPWVGGVVGLFALIGALTASSFIRDAGDEALEKRQDEATQLAHKARRLAVANGVPVSGGQDVYATAPMWRARLLYTQRCAGCHDKDSDDRKGPVIGPGHLGRSWFKAFLKAPSDDVFWGRTKLAKDEAAMKPVELAEAELEAVVEFLYAQGDAVDLDTSKHERGKTIVAEQCTDCHSLEEGVAGASAPSLARIGTRDWLTSFISNPKSPVHMGVDKSEMPRFDHELSIVDRDVLAGYLRWLRTATPADVAALDR